MKKENPSPTKLLIKEVPRTFDWKTFTTIMRAVESCKTIGCDPDDHSRGVGKMISIGKGAERVIEDFMLTGYACYLIA